MELKKLEVTRREVAGSNAMRALRRQGRVPGVIYGHKQDPVSFSTDGAELAAILDHHGQFVEINLGGAADTAIIREVQYDTWGQHVLHVDFVRVAADEPIDVAVGIELFGQPKGVAEGGVLQRQATEVNIRCAPRFIPNLIELNIKGLGIGDTICAKDLSLPEQAELVDDPEKVICGVMAPAAPAEDEATDGETPEGEAAPAADS